jgi:RNA polymerase sigma-70 factor, ECF subfamily
MSRPDGFRAEALPHPFWGALPRAGGLFGVLTRRRTRAADEPLARSSFDEVYAAQFAFVWRTLRRLGVPEDSLRDAAQDVFVVLLRKLPEFEGRAPLRSFLYSIVKRVAFEHRRAHARNDARGGAHADDIEGPHWHGPESSAEHGEALRLLYLLLGTLDDDKREAFVLAELEGLTVPEIAALTGANPNTLYARLRAARTQIRKAWAVHQNQPTRKP